MSERRFAVLLGTIATLALALRVAYVVLQSRFDLFVLAFEGGDAQFYLEIARNIASGHGMTVYERPTAFVGPGYPLFLGALLRLGADAQAVGLVQSALGAATAVIAGLTALEMAAALGLAAAIRRRMALVSAGLVAVYPHLIFWTGYILTETLFVFLVSVALYGMLRARRSAHAGWAIGAGLAAGAASITRAPFLVVSIALAIAWYWQARGTTAVGATARPVLAAIFLVAALAPVGVWTIRNVAVMGAPIVTSTESGYVFYQGNSPGATGGSRGYVDDKDFSLPPGPPPPGGEVVRDRFFLEHALTHIISDPIATVARWPAKVVNMWRPTYEDSSARNQLITLVSYVPVLLAGIVGAGVLLGRGGLRSPATTPAIVLLLWFGIHVAVTGMIRFRLPAELVLMEAAPFAALAFLRSRAPRG